MLSNKEYNKDTQMQNITYCSCNAAPIRIAHIGSALVLRIGIHPVVHSTRSPVWLNRDCNGILVTPVSIDLLGLQKIQIHIIYIYYNFIYSDTRAVYI